MRWSVLVRIVCQLTPLYRVREISEEFHYLFVLNQSKIFDFNNGTFLVNLMQYYIIYSFFLCFEVER